jgi:hypothetical protein
MTRFSTRFKFSDWPNSLVPMVAAGNYAIWANESLIYCGMSGRQFDPIVAASKKKHGLYTRLASHASGRLSGDQFCVYVANRFVIPSLTPEVFPRFADGSVRLDELTKRYIHQNFEYQFLCVDGGTAAYQLESECRRGITFGVKPYLNPIP